MGMKVGITLGRKTGNGVVEYGLDCMHARGESWGERVGGWRSKGCGLG